MLLSQHEVIMPAKKPAHRKPNQMARKDWTEGRDCKSRLELIGYQFTDDEIEMYKNAYHKLPALSLQDKQNKRAYCSGMKTGSRANPERGFEHYMASNRTQEEKDFYKKGYEKRREFHRLQQISQAAIPVVIVPENPIENVTTLDNAVKSPIIIPMFTRSNGLMNSASNLPTDTSRASLQMSSSTDDQLATLAFNNVTSLLYLLQQSVTTNLTLQQQLKEKEQIIICQNQRIAELEQQAPKQNQIGSAFSAFHSIKPRSFR